MTASSPSSWATACWPISAFRAPMRRTPSGRSGPASTSRPSSRSSTRARRRTLKVRIGIATGIVVVGDLVGQGSAQEQAVVGETPNLAARLQALAEPGSVVIAESTRRLLGGTFELKPLGPQTLKGFDAPVPAWTVLARGGERQPLRGVAVARHDALRRARARGGAAPGPLARRERGRGPGRAALGRGGHRQVAHSGGAARADRRRAACEDALSMLAAPRQRRLLSDHEPNLACGGFCQRRAGGGAARQAGGDDRAFGVGGEGHRAVPRRAAVDPRRGAIPPAGNGPGGAEGAHDRGADRAVRGADERRAGAGAAGGRALDRPDLARRVQPARRSAARPARAAGGHLPPGIRRAVGRPRACRLASTQPLRASAGAGDGRWRRRRQGAAGRSAGCRSSPRPTACRCSWRN